MKKILFIVLLISLLSDLLLSQEIYDLDKTIKTAINNSLDVQSISNNIDIQELTLKSTYGNLIPVFNINAGWSRNNTFSKGGILYQSGIPIFVGDQSRWQSDLRLGLNTQVTLFDGLANYQNIDLEKQNLASLKINLENIKYNIIINVYQNFFNVLKNVKIVEINQQNLKNSYDQLDKIKELVNAGRKTLSDTYKQDVQVAQDELSLEQSKNELDKSKVDLLFAMNEDINKIIEIDPRGLDLVTDNQELKKVVDRNRDVNDLFNNAINYRYDYKIAVKDIEISQTRFEISKKYLYYPTLTAYGNYNISGTKISEIDNSRVLNFGFTLSYSLFEGFRKDVNRQIAEINIKQKREDLDKIEKDIKSKIKKSIFDLETAYKQIEILERNIKSAEQDKFLSEENYRLGLGTLLDVQVASTNLNNLLINRINYIYNFYLAQKQIEYLSGKLKY